MVSFLFGGCRFTMFLISSRIQQGIPDSFQIVGHLLLSSVFCVLCVCVCPPLDKGFSTATLFNVFPPLSTGRGAVIPSAVTATPKQVFPPQTCSRFAAVRFPQSRMKNHFVETSTIALTFHLTVEPFLSSGN